MSLPFIVGRFYRPIETKTLWGILYGMNVAFDPYNVLPHSNIQNYYGSSYPRVPTVNFDGFVDDQYFCPIAYKETAQKIVGEVMIDFSKHDFPFMADTSGTGFNFGFSEVKTTDKKIIRVEIPIETFIKEFELVL